MKARLVFEKLLVIIAVVVLSFSAAVLTEFAVLKFTDSLRTPGMLAVRFVQACESLNYGERFLAAIGVDSLCYFSAILIAIAASNRLHRKDT